MFTNRSFAIGLVIAPSMGGYAAPREEQVPANGPADEEAARAMSPSFERS